MGNTLDPEYFLLCIVQIFSDFKCSFFEMPTSLHLTIMALCNLKTWSLWPHQSANNFHVNQVQLSTASKGIGRISYPIHKLLIQTWTPDNVDYWQSNPKYEYRKKSNYFHPLSHDLKRQTLFLSIAQWQYNNIWNILGKA